MSPNATFAPPQRYFEANVAPDICRVFQARDAASIFLQLWDMEDSLIEDVKLTVSELVTNALEHGYGRVTLKITELAGVVTVGVSDCNPAPARIRSAAQEDLTGRGLMLVAGLAQAWGVSEDGYTTWAKFSWRDRQNAPPRRPGAVGVRPKSIGRMSWAKR
ncbi:ATP-binding protein [Streptomyces sp. NPDC056663]|uniref:ATP-binding protein n=1 Tax=Streptomyces sp. NPDC056663 TaxID=3345899 RepID=UPI0036B2CF38